MHKSIFQCHMAVCCTYHRPTHSSQLLNRSHTKEAYLLTKHIEEFSGKSSGEWTSKKKKKKDNTKRVTGLGKRPRE